MQESDEILVANVQAGDMGSFRELVERYKKKVYHIAYDIISNHHDTEDISQEVFLNVYRSIREFRGDASFSSWLYRIVVNVSLNFRKKTSHHRSYPLEEDILQHADYSFGMTSALSGDPEEAVQSSMLNFHIQRALEELPERQQTIFLLRHYHGLTTKEVSHIMRCAEGTVKVQLFRAIRKLQKALAFYREEIGSSNGQMCKDKKTLC